MEMQNVSDPEIAFYFEIEELEERLEFKRWDPPGDTSNDNDGHFAPEVSYKFK